MWSQAVFPVAHIKSMLGNAGEVSVDQEVLKADTRFKP